MKLFKNKKGSALDILWIAGTLIALAVIILIVYKVSDEFNTKLSTDSTFNEYAGAENAKSSMNQMNNMYPGIIDNGFLVLAIGLSIAAIILAAMVRIHPVFLVFFIIIWALIIFLSGVFSNIYQEMAAQPEMTALADNLTFTTHILNYLPFIVGILGGVLAIIMYKMWSAAQ